MVSETMFSSHRPKTNDVCFRPCKGHQKQFLEFHQLQKLDPGKNFHGKKYMACRGKIHLSEKTDNSSSGFMYPSNASKAKPGNPCIYIYPLLRKPNTL
jgi:hypothetical protein